LHAGAAIAEPAGFDLFTEAIEQVAALFLALAEQPRLQRRG
jgi:hypothetical protein